MSRLEFNLKPLKVNDAFHRSPARERALFGAFGSGKTYALCDEVIMWCLQNQGARAVLMRKTVPELRDTTETVFYERLPHEIYKAGEERRAGGHSERFIFPGGSEVLFRGVDDWVKHKSLNVSLLAYDEADEFDKETYEGMMGRLRQRDPTKIAKALGAGPITNRGVILATNPNGHDWLYKRFVGGSASDRGAFFATTLDNPYLPRDYIESLLDMPEQFVKRFVLCQFDDFAGQIYPEWNYETHMIDPIAPNQFARGSVFWMGMDPGLRSPTAGLWVWLDVEHNRLVAINEYQLANAVPETHCAEWRRMEARGMIIPSWRVADPSIMERDKSTLITLKDQYSKLGFNFQRGPKRYRDRIPALGRLIAAREPRFVATKDLTIFPEQLINYKWADLTPAQRAQGKEGREEPQKKDDHTVNCAEYLASRYVKPLSIDVPNEQRPVETQSEEFQRIIRQNVRTSADGRRSSSTRHDLSGVRV